MKLPLPHPRCYGRILLVGITMSILIACTPVTTPQPGSLSGESVPESLVQVATSTAFIADWVSQVGDDQVTVIPLLPEGEDPHDYRPSPQDIIVLSESDLIFQVGLGLEESWLAEFLSIAQEGGAEVIVLGEYVDVLSVQPHESAESHGEGDHEDEGADDHAEGSEDEDHKEGVDPHFWLDPLQVKSVVTGIATHLSRLNPAMAEDFQMRAATYNTDLDELHSWILEQVQTIPAEQRILVTGHEFMRYFAYRYDFEVIGSISGSTDTAHSHEVPALELAELVAIMRERGVKAIFTEFGHESELAARAAEEAGIELVIPLYTGSLGPEGSYISMMRANVLALVEALQ